MAKSDAGGLKKDRLGDVSWLFVQFSAVFGREFERRYPKQKTRVMAKAKIEWGRVISGYSRGEMRLALSFARQSGDQPPSTTDFWRMLERARAQERKATERERLCNPPNRELGKSSIAVVKSMLGRG